jgi:hypothetical protein
MLVTVKVQPLLVLLDRVLVEVSSTEPAAAVTMAAAL